MVEPGETSLSNPALSAESDLDGLMTHKALREGRITLGWPD